MPNHGLLSCCIEIGEHQARLPEYGTTYLDRTVETYVAIPKQSTPFGIYVETTAYVAPGLAAFVYIDGQYQGNRNKVGATPADGKLAFRFGQKEDHLRDGRVIAKGWSFEKLNIVEGKIRPTLNENVNENLGVIEIVILRCASSQSTAESKSQQQTAEIDPWSFPRLPAHYFVPVMGTSGNVTSNNHGTVSLQVKNATEKSQPAVEEPEVDGLMNGLFDGPADYEDDYYTSTRRRAPPRYPQFDTRTSRLEQLTVTSTGENGSEFDHVQPRASRARRPDTRYRATEPRILDQIEQYQINNWRKNIQHPTENPVTSPSRLSARALQQHDEQIANGGRFRRVRDRQSPVVAKRHDDPTLRYARRSRDVDEVERYVSRANFEDDHRWTADPQPLPPPPYVANVRTPSREQVVGDAPFSYQDRPSAYGRDGKYPTYGHQGGPSIQEPTGTTFTGNQGTPPDRNFRSNYQARVPEYQGQAGFNNAPYNQARDYTYIPSSNQPGRYPTDQPNRDIDYPRPPQQEYTHPYPYPTQADPRTTKQPPYQVPPVQPYNALQPVQSYNMPQPPRPSMPPPPPFALHPHTTRPFLEPGARILSELTEDERRHVRRWLRYQRKARQWYSFDRQMNARRRWSDSSSEEGWDIRSTSVDPIKPKRTPKDNGWEETAEQKAAREKELAEEANRPWEHGFAYDKKTNDAKPASDAKDEKQTTNNNWTGGGANASNGFGNGGDSNNNNKGNDTSNNNDDSWGSTDNAPADTNNNSWDNSDHAPAPDNNNNSWDTSKTAPAPDNNNNSWDNSNTAPTPDSNNNSWDNSNTAPTPDSNNNSWDNGNNAPAAGNKTNSWNGNGNDESKQVKETSKKECSKTKSKSKGKARELNAAGSDEKPYTRSYFHQVGKGRETEKALARVSTVSAPNKHTIPEDPIYTISRDESEEKHVKHQVRGGKGQEQTLRTRRPEYWDSLDAPYVCFRFKYRSRDMIKEILGEGITESPEEFKDWLGALSKEQLIAEMLRQKEAGAWMSDSDSYDSDSGSDGGSEENKDRDGNGQGNNAGDDWAQGTGAAATNDTAGGGDKGGKTEKKSKKGKNDGGGKNIFTPEPTGSGGGGAPASGEAATPAGGW